MAPEMIVRRLAHRLGYRFRLHRADLPGKPDLTFPKLRKVILVNGCFWHQHQGCADSHIPKTRVEYWGPKLARNKERDRRTVSALEATGWKCLTVWECEIRKPAELAETLRAFLSSTAEG
jgi:DNA mismatch endonuclease (patch repair protein)